MISFLFNKEKKIDLTKNTHLQQDLIAQEDQDIQRLEQEITQLTSSCELLKNNIASQDDFQNISELQKEWLNNTFKSLNQDENNTFLTLLDTKFEIRDELPQSKDTIIKLIKFFNIKNPEESSIIKMKKYFMVDDSEKSEKYVLLQYFLKEINKNFKEIISPSKKEIIIFSDSPIEVNNTKYIISFLIKNNIFSSEKPVVIVKIFEESNPIIQQYITFYNKYSKIHKLRKEKVELSTKLNNLRNQENKFRF